MTTEQRIEIPSSFTRSAVGGDREIASAGWLVERMCALTGRSDLADTEVLDMGCGVKLTKLFLNHGVPIKRYVGVDVFAEMIDFLRENVDDPRFEYHHIDVRNEKYNPAGQPFTERIELPIGAQTFDLICLFSVFTHLSPTDYRTMLRLMRRHIRSDGRLFFTLYVNELTPGGHGLMDGWAPSVAAREAELRAQVADRVASGRPAVEPFVDLDPARPLNWAVYSEEHARELIDDSGWRVVSLSDPDLYIQHHFVCAPA